MSDNQHSTDGLMALVQSYANQEVQCVARSEDEAYWGLFRERERMGDDIRAYLEAMLQNAYADGRNDESEAADNSGLRDYFAAAVNMDGVALSALEALEGPFPAYADAKAKQDWYARAEAAFRYHRADAMLNARQA